MSRDSQARYGGGLENHWCKPREFESLSRRHLIFMTSPTKDMISVTASHNIAKGFQEDLQDSYRFWAF